MDKYWQCITHTPDPEELLRQQYEDLWDEGRCLLYEIRSIREELNNADNSPE